MARPRPFGRTRKDEVGAVQPQRQRPRLRQPARPRAQLSPPPPALQPPHSSARVSAASCVAAALVVISAVVAAAASLLSLSLQRSTKRALLA
jgi:hypothetical protein